MNMNIKQHIVNYWVETEVEKSCIVSLCTGVGKVYDCGMESETLVLN